MATPFSPPCAERTTAHLLENAELALTAQEGLITAMHLAPGMWSDNNALAAFDEGSEAIRQLFLALQSRLSLDDPAFHALAVRAAYVLPARLPNVPLL